MAREAAHALDETDLVPSEPMTLVLSSMGWIRAAKGHDIDPTTLSYREGDGLLAAARTRSNLQAGFLDASGRAYSTPVHTLPSARGNGEPLTGRFTPPPGTAFTAMASGEESQRFLLASSHGYGFITAFANFIGRNKAGKQLINLANGASVIAPMPVSDPGSGLVVAITSAGHLLAFAASELPELDKGKGNKLIQIPPARLKSGQELLTATACVPEGGGLTLYCGQRKLILSWRDLQAYGGSRAQRGHLLPRGFQRVDRVEVEQEPGR